MRDPDLVTRAQRAAAALERAWERWRAMHGLTAEPMTPVTSYVGYSIEEPWGRPRVVFGVDAREAELLAALLDRHECIGPFAPAERAAAEPARRAEPVAGGSSLDEARSRIPAQAQAAEEEPGQRWAPGASPASGSPASGSPGSGSPGSPASGPTGDRDEQHDQLRHHGGRSPAEVQGQHPGAAGPPRQDESRGDPDRAGDQRRGRRGETSRTSRRERRAASRQRPAGAREPMPPAGPVPGPRENGVTGRAGSPRPPAGEPPWADREPGPAPGVPVPPPEAPVAAPGTPAPGTPAPGTPPQQLRAPAAGAGPSAAPERPEDRDEGRSPGHHDNGAARGHLPDAGRSAGNPGHGPGSGAVAGAGETVLAGTKPAGYGPDIDRADDLGGRDRAAADNGAAWDDAGEAAATGAGAAWDDATEAAGDGSGAAWDDAGDGNAAAWDDATEAAGDGNGGAWDDAGDGNAAAWADATEAAGDGSRATWDDAGEAAWDDAGEPGQDYAGNGAPGYPGNGALSHPGNGAAGHPGRGGPGYAGDPGRNRDMGTAAGLDQLWHIGRGGPDSGQDHRQDPARGQAAEAGPAGPDASLPGTSRLDRPGPASPGGVAGSSRALAAPAGDVLAPSSGSVLTSAPDLGPEAGPPAAADVRTETIAAELAGWAAGELPGQASARLAAWAAIGGLPAPAYRRPDASDVGAAGVGTTEPVR